MPKLWDETIASHRQAVRDATVDTTATLVAERGLRSVTMSEIAERTGIGRATLYKYFPDVDSILATWHQRQIERHLDHLVEVRDRVEEPGRRLESVLAAYALIQRERAQHQHTEPHPSGPAMLLHGEEHVAEAQRQLHAMITNLIAEAAAIGEVRDDVSAGELATYSIHALAAAGQAPGDDAVHRLVEITLDGLRR